MPTIVGIISVAKADFIIISIDRAEIAVENGSRSISRAATARVFLLFYVRWRASVILTKELAVLLFIMSVVPKLLLC